MKNWIILFISLFLSTLTSIAEWRDGDIILQETAGQQAEVVKLATKSNWTHTGVVFIHQGTPMVLEAVQPVRVTALKDFLKRSHRGNYQVMRLKDPSPLTQSSISKAHLWAKEQVGKQYDAQFLWSDNHLYCSELVWKVFQSCANVELCKPKTIRDYDLSHPKVQALIKQRYGSVNRLPLSEKVVAPSDIAESPLLEIVDRPSKKG
ncbi:Permuted papain-like amidase enzyme, YaeF/YiiX, C92 family [Rubritalea squalenifaciens DSM 18772]|uniref:Permuted papain-like amidase enzyme, YaeF/YiiX, C92 family n=1 Tax=Rubritalea squalenifaciens DSM 18772 TaxID=1123071 RepID=A0A1M6MHV8_9BACT|nr:YiiX/YebB-like N1pC/P60 family cysteine hydrolase [Rubritalea squalenifaciens]SHJ83099.1 Permuted papain-like amidase enzyme, YaeF/YiiX, C92 family [Rubritalea squalenifaciens DSM 18772]